MTKLCIDKTRLIAAMNANRKDLPGSGAILGRFYAVVGGRARFFRTIAEVERAFKAGGVSSWGRYV